MSEREGQSSSVHKFNAAPAAEKYLKPGESVRSWTCCWSLLGAVIGLLAWSVGPFIIQLVSKNATGHWYLFFTTLFLFLYSLVWMLKLASVSDRSAIYHELHFVPAKSGFTAMFICTTISLFMIVYLWSDAPVTAFDHIINGQAQYITQGRTFDDEYIRLVSHVNRWSLLLSRAYMVVYAGAVYMCGMYVFSVANVRTPCMIDKRYQAKRINTGYLNGRIYDRRKAKAMIEGYYNKRHVRNTNTLADTDDEDEEEEV